MRKRQSRQGKKGREPRLFKYSKYVLLENMLTSTLYKVRNESR
jgi:hypothetical protein